MALTFFEIQSGQWMSARSAILRKLLVPRAGKLATTLVTFPALREVVADLVLATLSNRSELSDGKLDDGLVENELEQSTQFIEAKLQELAAPSHLAALMAWLRSSVEVTSDPTNDDKSDLEIALERAGGLSPATIHELSREGFLEPLLRALLRQPTVYEAPEDEAAP